MATTSLPLSEIQGLLASGYARQRAMCFLLLRVVDSTLARDWLAQTVPLMSFCDNKSSTSKLNLAFTFPGLEQFLDQQDLKGFSREFREGMVTGHRQRVLGDLEGSRSDPTQWSWGGPHCDVIHAMLLVYENHPAALERRLDEINQSLRGWESTTCLRSTALKGKKEHFGFHDGIGQPWIEGLHRRNGHARDRVSAGELILGYDDNTGVPEPASELATNGSYLVLRQLVQLVPEFWNAFGDVSDDEKLRRAAKKVGRWPDGTPLTLSPDQPDRSQPLNDFVFTESDADGNRCPLGAHIRRANPRDSLPPSPAASLEISNRHRILRRGRSFGLPAPPETFPGELAVYSETDAVGETEARGLYFMCLNASLSRQFEFCQQSWLNNPKFLGLANETDGVASPVQWSGPDERPVLTEQASPLRLRRPEHQKYIYTTGGSYFFLPGRAALGRLAASR